MKRNPGTGNLNRRHLSALTAICLLCASTQALAQTLDAPEGICVGERFNVEWTGPGGAGDAIVLATRQQPVDEFIDLKPTAAGNPVRLRGPATPGLYEIRYRQNEPMSVLVTRELNVERCDEDIVPVGEEYQRVAVRINGWQTDYGDNIEREQMTQYGPAGYSLEEFCDASGAAGWALQAMVDHVELEMYSAGAPFSFDTLAMASGAPTRAEIERDMQNGRDEVCDQTPPETTHQPFVITYAYCRMAMKTPTHTLDIHLPPGTGNGSMSMADHGSQEGMVMALRRRIGELEELTGQGWDSGLSLSGAMATGTRAGYAASPHSFKYTVGLGGQGGVLGAIAGRIKVTNEGTAWISSQVPGIDIVRLFYQRLTTEVSPNGAGMSFFGGLINNLVAMLSYGMPLDIDQTTTSKAAAVIRIKGRSRNLVTSVELVDFGPEWCDASLIPAGYDITDVDQQLAEAMGGADGQDMSQAMQEYNEAMSQMTPEQLAMMESLGMSDMMQPPGGSPGGGAASPPGGTCNAPSSAELTNNNVLQSVQKHLEALGYSTGNTSGEASLATTIAISQFQTEKGMDVTGEVTPQLLGVLSAEVDGQCS